jgi:Putative Zn-dependent protease, contains TPR repeats
MTRIQKYMLFSVSLAFTAFFALSYCNKTAWAQEDTIVTENNDDAAQQPKDDPAPEEKEEKSGKNENAGLEILNQAIEIKMSAETMRDLNTVIRLCEKAKEDGLSQDNEDFCNQLLAATLIQRGIMIADIVLETRPLPPGWKEYRDLALSDFEQAFKYIPEEPMNYLYIARLNLLPDGDREKAAEFAEKAIEYCSGNDEIHAQALIVKADLTDDPKKQIELLREANGILPDSLPILVLLGGVLAADDQLDEAIKALQKVLDIDSENVQALEFAAAIRVQQEKYDEAIKIFDRLGELLPRSFVPQIQKAEVLQEQKKFDEALAVLNALRDREPGNPLILLQRGLLYTTMKKYDEALRDIESTLRLTSDFPDLESRAASAKIAILCEQEKFADALTFLQKFPKAKQATFPYQLMTVQVYAMAKSNDKAIELLDKMLVEDPDNVVLKRFRGDMLLGLGQHAEAIAVYKGIIEDGDADDGVYNNLSWVLATSPEDDLRDGKLALEYALESCELSEYKKPHIISTLASAYAELNDFDNAVKWIEKGLELAKETEYDQADHLADELKSYQEKKPWREKLNENEPDPLATETSKVTTKESPKPESPQSETKTDAEQAADEAATEAADEVVFEEVE